MKSLPFCAAEFKNIPCVISVGVFDGMHIGHVKILKKCVEIAKKLNAFSVVITFSVNPKMFCGCEAEFPSIISATKTDQILRDLGLDYHCEIDFSTEMSKISGEEFIARLCNFYDVRAMVAGSSFRCGCRESNVGIAEIRNLLSKYASSAFLETVPSAFLNGEEVSSSLIRRCLLTGDFGKASKLLGRPYIPADRSDTAV